jgi:hypothetical protein
MYAITCYTLAWNSSQTSSEQFLFMPDEINTSESICKESYHNSAFPIQNGM